MIIMSRDMQMIKSQVTDFVVMRDEHSGVKGMLSHKKTFS